MQELAKALFLAVRLDSLELVFLLAEHVEDETVFASVNEVSACCAPPAVHVCPSLPLSVWQCGVVVCCLQCECVNITAQAGETVLQAACALNRSSIFGLLFDQWAAMHADAERAAAALQVAESLSDPLHNGNGSVTGAESQAGGAVDFEEVTNKFLRDVSTSS